MNIIRDIDAGKFLSANGMVRNGYTPAIAFGMKPTWEISWIHADGSAVDLSGVVAWSAAIDNDYRDDTQVMCRTVVGITVDGHTTIVPLNANTVTYRAKVTGKASIAAIFQLKGFAANGDTIFLQKFPVLAGYDIDPDMEGEPEEVPSGEGLDATDVAGIAQAIVDQAFANYTPPQTPGPTGPAPILQYSANAIAWHSTWQDGDLYARISSDNGETWGPAMRWGAGQVALPEIVVYDPAEVYVIGQVVTYGDPAGVYQCIEDANYSQSPESHAEKWRLICAPGATGQAGATWLSASGVPDPEAGVDGDNYIDLDTYNHYLKSGGAWIQRGCLRGQNGAGIVWRGAWSAEATYLAGDAVSKAGSLWRAVAAHSNQEPPDDPTTASIAWEIFLARGEQGLPGTTGTIQIAGINILSPTADPYASEAATSTPQRRLYILNIPRGSTGPAGQLRITMGAPLEPEDDPTLIEQPTSTPYSRVYQLRVPMGPKGEQGTGLHFDYAGPLADRVNYDAADRGFVFAATDILTDDTGAHYQAMYYKRSATFADWSDPLRLYLGAKGEPGESVKGDPGIDGNAAYAKPDHEFTELDLVDRAVVIPGTTPVASVELYDQFGHAHALTLGSSASSQAAITYRADINTTLALIAAGEDVTYGGRVRFAQGSTVISGDGSGPALSDENPAALAAAAAPGESQDAARADHAHPTTGLATLVDGKVPASMLPTIPAPGPALSNAAAAVLADTAAAGTSGEAARADHVHPNTGLVKSSAIGAVNGVAGLGADGKVPTGQLPTVTPSITAAEVRKIAMLQAIIFG